MNLVRAQVRDVHRLGRHMVRVEFGGDELPELPWSGVPDERLRLMLPAGGSGSSDAPGDAAADAPDRATVPVRNYTARRWDPDRGVVTVDFVVHDGGVASAWAAQARPGQQLYVHLGGSWYSPPPDAVWQLLVADLAGLPALARTVEQLPSGARAHALVEVIEPDDAQRIDSAADVDIRWLTGSGNGVSASELPDAVGAFRCPDGPGYVWAATEATASRQIRRTVRHGWQLDPDHYSVIAYWRADSERWLNRYRAVEADLSAAIEAARAAGRSDEDVRDLWEDELDRAGL